MRITFRAMGSFVEVTRGPHVESRHRIHAAVVTPGGRLHAHCGDPALVTFWRSAAKFFQAIPLVATGAADALGVTPAELALACSSHNGEPRHVAVARQLLERSRSGEADLVCGTHPSLNEDLARAQVASGEWLTRVHSNCSGKHAGMLALAARQGWPRAGYERIDHAVQQGCLAEVRAWTGLSDDGIGWATDGCGLPTFTLDLTGMARAYARLAEAAEGRDGDGPAEGSRAAARRLAVAVAAEPFLLAGTGRLDTELIGAVRGRIISKVGAEGVYCAALRDAGLGVALKVEDGSWRALGPALLAVLDQLAPGAVPELDGWRHRPLLNSNDVEVGEVRARVDLMSGAPK
jgi:L-asparaginase II